MKVFNLILTIVALMLCGLSVYLMTADIYTDEERIEMCLEETFIGDYTYSITEYSNDRVRFRVYDESGEWVGSVSIHDNSYQTFAGKLMNYVGDLVNN